MSHYPDEEWERKNSSLVRPKVENISKPSDVPEETRDRSYSPLPELNIEKIPNRHDEPEEFYEQLAIRMRKLHKKMFKIKQDAESEEKKEVTNFNSIILKHDDSDNEDAFSLYDGQNLTTNTYLTYNASEDIKIFTEIKDIVKFDNTFRIQSSDRTNTNSDQTDSSYNEDYNKNDEFNMPNSSPSPAVITNSTKADSALDNDDEPIIIRLDNVSDELENTNIASSSKTDLGSKGDISETNNESNKSDDEINENGQTSDSEEESQQASEIVDDINNIDKDVRHHFNRKILSTILEDSDPEIDEGNNNSRLEINTEVNKRHAHKSRDLDASTGASNNAISPTASLLSFEKNEIEVMRGKAKISSESLTVLPENNSILNKSFIARDISFDIDNEEAQTDRFEETPKISNEPDSNYTTENPRKRHSDGEGFDVLVKKHKIDNAAQTDVEHVTWSTLHRNFFIGVPKIYNLCSCKQHKCNA